MAHADVYLREHPDASILLATDSPRFLRKMSQRYGTRLVAREALRSERNAFLEAGATSKKGEDVLIDALLLSRVSFLLKSSSAVGEFNFSFYPWLRNGLQNRGQAFKKTRNSSNQAQ